MQKQNEFVNTMAMEAPQQFPAAPPSYDDAAFKSPDLNSQMPPAAAQAQHVQAAPSSAPAPPAPLAQVIICAPSPQPVVMALGPEKANVICPKCQMNVQTVTSSEYKTSAHIYALVCCLVGCWFCCWLPYCMDSFENIHHDCPNCGGLIGTYEG